MCWESTKGTSKSHLHGRSDTVHCHQRGCGCVGLPQSSSWVRAGWIVSANPNHCFPGNYFWSLLDLITQ